MTYSFFLSKQVQFGYVFDMLECNTLITQPCNLKTIKIGRYSSRLIEFWRTYAYIQKTLTYHAAYYSLLVTKYISLYVLHPNIGGLGTVVESWIAGQQVERSIMHQGNDS